MTLLLVDDQINVINGLMNGINYRKLEIDTVRPSTSVQEAKTLICENQIDILMTDIEMPGENGLQLLHWVSENYPDIVCILLTSHADFSYAQESIKLGCFDYVVQPAPYQEIEDALLRAAGSDNTRMLSNRISKPFGALSSLFTAPSTSTVAASFRSFKSNFVFPSSNTH